MAHILQLSEPQRTKEKHITNAITIAAATSLVTDFGSGSCRQAVEKELHAELAGQRSQTKTK